MDKLAPKKCDAGIVTFAGVPLQRSCLLIERLPFIVPSAVLPDGEVSG